MAKRFTATDKWDDPWFCGLSDTDKLFWFYMLDKCDHAGIWQVNWPLVQFHIKGLVNKEAFNGRIKELSAAKWFIQKFIDFQYGTLDPANRAHGSVINILEKEGAYKPLITPLQGRKDMDKDKEKDKDSEFNAFWTAYPKKSDKKNALRAWGKHKPPLDKCLSTLAWQVKSEAWLKADPISGQKGAFIPMPTTWINGGRWDDVPQGFIEVSCSKCGKPGVLPESAGSKTPICRTCKEAK